MVKEFWKFLAKVFNAVNSSTFKWSVRSSVRMSVLSWGMFWLTSKMAFISIKSFSVYFSTCNADSRYSFCFSRDLLNYYSIIIYLLFIIHETKVAPSLVQSSW